MYCIANGDNMNDKWTVCNKGQVLTYILIEKIERNVSISITLETRCYTAHGTCTFATE